MKSFDIYALSNTIKQIKINQCKQCKGKIANKRKDAIFCSKNCRERFHNQEKITNMAIGAGVLVDHVFLALAGARWVR